MATAICGNDIMSSCLYVSGIAILFAGVFGPLILLTIGLVLFFYKKVYTEVVEALPVNGGAYNCLLNGTSKTIAALAGIMTFLSYIATAVISAKVGVEYLGLGIEHAAEQFFHTTIDIPVIPVTIAVLFAFALLVISGVKDSARVAFAIFATHIVTLIVFLAVGAFFFMNGGESFWAQNWEWTTRLLENPAGTKIFEQAAHGGITTVIARGGLLPTLYLAFSASLLGVSGFESSANFVEEQGKGVFRKTLRNMLAGVVIFNPLLALVVLVAMPYTEIVTAKDFLLADAANVIGGSPLLYIVSVDAFLVLCGAVLTSYVGVSGLMNRMSGDACIPAFFGKMNKKGSFPRIVLSFFALCSSILVATGGDLLSLAGVYTIAFLGVMSLFALGNLILKEARHDLKRTYNAPVIVVVLAFLATTFGMIGNIRIDPKNLSFFEMYFIPSFLLVLGVIYQDKIMRILLRATKSTFPALHRYLKRHFSDMTEGKFIAFVHHANRLHTLLDYIDRNETGQSVTVVYCNNKDLDDEDDEKNFQEIKETLPYLAKAGFLPHFKVDLKYVNKPFGPDVIDEVSEELGVRKNRILIGSIHAFHQFNYDELGGVRIVFG